MMRRRPGGAGRLQVRRQPERRRRRGKGAGQTLAPWGRGSLFHNAAGRSGRQGAAAMDEPCGRHGRPLRVLRRQGALQRILSRIRPEPAEKMSCELRRCVDAPPSHREPRCGRTARARAASRRAGCNLRPTAVHPPACLAATSMPRDGPALRRTFSFPASGRLLGFQADPAAVRGRACCASPPAAGPRATDQSASSRNALIGHNALFDSPPLAGLAAKTAARLVPTWSPRLCPLRLLPASLWLRPARLCAPRRRGCAAAWPVPPGRARRPGPALPAARSRYSTILEQVACLNKAGPRRASWPVP